MGIDTPAFAGTLRATSATIKAVFASAKAGDTIVLTGTFGRVDLTDRSFAKALKIDARKATFTDSLIIRRVNGLTIVGGTYGSTTGTTSYNKAIAIYNSANLSVSNASFVGSGIGTGIAAQSSNNISVAKSSFTLLRTGVSFGGVTDGSITSNKSVKSASDGFDIADSHRVMVTGNSCSGSAPSQGAHPDCVQLWSIKGNAPQSDITIANNTATGTTQGFTSFNSADGGGVRIKMINNRVDTSLSQGLACYGCYDSVFTGNVLTTLPGSKYKTNMNIVGGSNNVIAGNSIGPKPSGTSKMTMLASANVETKPFGDVASVDLDSARGSFTGIDSNVSTVTGAARRSATVERVQSAVPEPASWLMMLTGFALAGTRMRARRSVAA